MDQDIIKLHKAEQYLYSLSRHGIKLGLNNIREVLFRMGDPQEKLSAVHVAGTNGKGSTAAMMSYMLAAKGYRVGIYTSPHLISIRERIAVISQTRCRWKMISAKSFCKLAGVVRAACENKKPRLRITFFEALTAIAFIYFTKKDVDFVILETGMGGRLDATNIAKSLVSIITNVEKEHAQWLGGTIPKIALEKAGIIKENVPLITAEKKAETLRVLNNVCRERRSPFYRVAQVEKGGNFHNKPNGSIIEWSRSKNSGINISCLGKTYRNIRLPLPGKHQIENAAAAIGAMHVLMGLNAKPGIKLTGVSLVQGLSRAKWPCRFEVVSRNPQVVIDAGHNPAAFLALKDLVRQQCSSKNVYLILSILDDKDAEAMCRILVPLAKKVVIAKLKTPRFSGAERLELIIKKMGYSAVLRSSVKNAVSWALAHVRDPRNDLILITGSIYLAGEAKEYFEKKKKTPDIRRLHGASKIQAR